MSNQSESSTDICKAASKSCYSFRLPGDNRNEINNSNDSKDMRPGFGGFALCTKSKVEKSGHVTGLHLSSERRDRTDARADRSSDPRGPRSDPKSEVHPADGFFRYDVRIFTFPTRSHPIPAQRYVKAGFYYSGEGDKVVCPWCNLNLIE